VEQSQLRSDMLKKYNYIRNGELKLLKFMVYTLNISK